MVLKIGNKESYTREIIVSASTGAAYKALTDEIGNWWTTPDCNASEVGATPTFSFDKDYWTMKVEKLVHEKKIVWKCIDGNERQNTSKETLCN